MLEVFIETEFDTSSENDVSLKHGCFINLGIFINEPEILFFSLKFDVDNEFSSVKSDTFHVDYAHTENRSCYNATLSHKHPSATMTKAIQDPIMSYLLIAQPKWHFSQKVQSCEKIFWFSIFSTCLGTK